MSVKNRKTSEYFSRSIIIGSLKKVNKEYRAIVIKGSLLNSDSMNREEYLKRGSFIFLLFSYLSSAISLTMIWVLYSNNLASYIPFFIIYLPSSVLIIIGTFFGYFEKQTAQGFTISFDKVHLILSIIIGLFIASALAALPFLESVE